MNTYSLLLLYDGGGCRYLGYRLLLLLDHRLLLGLSGHLHCGCGRFYGDNHLIHLWLELRLRLWWLWLPKRLWWQRLPQRLWWQRLPQRLWRQRTFHLLDNRVDDLLGAGWVTRLLDLQHKFLRDERF